MKKLILATVILLAGQVAYAEDTPPPAADAVPPAAAEGTAPAKPAFAEFKAKLLKNTQERIAKAKLFEVCVEKATAMDGLKECRDQYMPHPPKRERRGHGDNDMPPPPPQV